ncbi:nuclear pore complex protein NUP1 isoform X2 [Humulus lupulus]|uniref:nuclear pore complex protein NUP1 isoform X2 n=1 Tax=Humulus lupulus TaxID=3486 RepID=UPI002B41533F|nr:nuclear pore complex protein NUP1 isoform X2 [Humulus lupulus]
MATAREEQQQPYEGGGLGAGGKFRKKPFRKTTHSTPYDRPPTVFRNPNNGGGWLSKLVDPAHRLISASAHRLFSSVFTKRLTQPQPQPQPPSSPLPQDCEAGNKQQETVATDSSGAQKGAIDQSNGPSTSFSGGELTELEQILQQKTFTRSEIDHLTALLHSRTIGLAIEDKEKKPEVIPIKQVASADRQQVFPDTVVRGNMIESDGFPKTPVPGNMIESQFVSPPVVSSTVLEGDVASPTDVVELAKSYMHKRPISPSMLGFRSQAVKENSTALYTRNQTSPSKLPVTPFVPRTSGHVEARENGFITPRSRGRSAIYSMARTPYSRVYQTTSLKSGEKAIDVYTGPSSSSQHAPDQNLLSRSKQGSSKRRGSLLDNDIGSYGAIRRIRQKPNLLSSRGLSSPVSGSPIGSAGSRLGSESDQNPSSSVLKPPFGEPKRNFFKPSTDNGENVVSNTTVPFKSSEMASKILQQIDKLVSPKDKSSQSKVYASMDKLPSKLSPSMLRGQALKSLEDVDSSKIFSNIQNNKSLEDSLDMRLPDAQEFTSQRLDKAKDNGPFKYDFPYGQSTSKMNDRDFSVSEVNGANSIVPRKDNVPSTVTSVPAASNSVAYPQHKRRTFRMSAHEDFVDLDDDSHSNGSVFNSLGEGREKENSSLIERTSIATEDVIREKASALTEIKPAAPELNKKNDIGTLAWSVTAEKSTNLVFQSTSPSTTAPTVSKAVSFLTTDSATPLKESNVSPSMFNFGDKISSSRDADAAFPVFNLGLKSADKVSNSQFMFSSSSASGSEIVNFGASSDSKPGTSSNLSTVATGAVDSVPKSPEPDKNNSNVGVSFRASETALPSAASTSSTNIFAFGTTPRDVGLNNGFSASISSTPVVSSTSQNTSNGALFGNSGSNITTPSTLTFATGSGSLSTSTPAPAVPVSVFVSSKASPADASVTETSSVPAPSVFKFGSSTDSTAIAPDTETSSVPVSPVTKFGHTAPSGVAPVLETSSVSAASAFKFSTASPAVPPVSETFSDVNRGAIKTEQGTSVGNSSTTAFSATAPANASSGSAILGFSAVATSSTSTTQSQGSFGAGSSFAPSSQASPAGTGLATFSQSIPFQFGSSSGSSPTFGLSGSTTFSSGSSPFGSTTSIKPFSSAATPGLGSSSLSEANLVSSSSSSTPTVFVSNWQPSKSPSVFNFNASPTTFSFGATSAASTTTNSSPSIFGASTPAATNGAPAMFGSSNGASSSSPFLFNSSSGPASTTQPVFGNPSPTFAFGASSGHNDQMSMEDSMAEDTVQASAPAVPGFGQQTISPAPSPFAFGSAPAPSVANPFQFGGQPNLANPQNPSPFQAGSLGLIADGSNFSLGSGGSGVDKSNRKYIKVKSKQRKK